MSKNLMTDMEKFFIGWDKMLNGIGGLVDLASQSMTNYPPFNIKKSGENQYTIEMAVAGFSKNEIDILLDDDKLIIKGNTSSDEEEDNYLYKALSSRAFTRKFQLADNIEIKSAKMINGMLNIMLEALVPAPKAAKKIDIGE